MSLEEVLNWIESIMDWCLRILAFLVIVGVIGFVAGYVTEKYAVVVYERKLSDKCINSACDGSPCKAKFVRHQGECK